MAVEKNKKYGITNMNGISMDDDRTCAFTDMNCLADEEKSFSLTDMNAAKNQDDMTCALEDMNCLGE